MVKMIDPKGNVVEVPQGKVDRNLTRGFSMPNTKPEPEQVQEMDSHEEIEQNEEEA